MKTMLIALLALLALPVCGQEYFTATGTAQGATNSYALINKKMGVPCVFFVDATVRHIDNTNGVTLRFYNAVTMATLTQAGVSGTNTLYLSATNGFAIGDVVVLSRNKDANLERHTVSAVAGTYITITGTTGAATVSGDKAYCMAVAGTVGHADVLVAHGTAPGSLRLLGGFSPIFSGVEGRPTLVEITGTQTNTLNTVSGRWLPTTR